MHFIPFVDCFIQWQKLRAIVVLKVAVEQAAMTRTANSDDMASAIPVAIDWVFAIHVVFRVGSRARPAFSRDGLFG
jgi:hypothetical protein